MTYQPNSYLWSILVPRRPPPVGRQFARGFESTRTKAIQWRRRPKSFWSLISDGSDISDYSGSLSCRRGRLQVSVLFDTEFPRTCYKDCPNSWNQRPHPADHTNLAVSVGLKIPAERLPSPLPVFFPAPTEFPVPIHSCRNSRSNSWAIWNCSSGCKSTTFSCVFKVARTWAPCNWYREWLPWSSVVSSFAKVSSQAPATLP